MTQKCRKPSFTSSLKNSTRFFQLLKPYRNLKMWVTLYVCSLSLNLTEKIFVQFQLEAELLFSSLWNSSMVLVLTFIQSSIKFMTSLASLHSLHPLHSLHSNQGIAHAGAWVSADYFKICLMFFPSKNWRPSLIWNCKPVNTSRPLLKAFSPKNLQ